jgi:Spy/CpxP family protein refolding chaperone
MTGKCTTALRTLFTVKIMHCALLIMVATLMLVNSTPGFAGDWLGTDSRSITKGTFWRFVLRLEVTDGQKAQIKPLFTEQQQQGQKIDKDSSISARDRQSKIDDLDRAIHAKVLSKLTPAQRDQLKSMPGFRP